MINLSQLEILPGFISATDKLLPIEMKIEVDNRELSFESVFIAIVGTRFNPLKNLEKVIERDCKFVIYEKDEINDKEIEHYTSKLVFIAVENIENFIQVLGKQVALNFKERGGKIIAISGSNGKTTTKEMLYHLIKESQLPHDVICTQKNNNNHLGVPFTLFQITENTKFAIVELGSNHPGEIEVLCKILNPQIGVTTNIGDTHLEFFETRENVFKEEAILRHYCSEKFYINSDDELLKNITNLNVGTSFGEGQCDHSYKISENNWTVEGEKLENENITGKHNKINMSVAYIISKQLGINPKALQNAVQKFKPTTNRSQWIQREDTKIFLDAYNANPSSMKASVLGFLDVVKGNGYSFKDCSLIIGDMNELGGNASKYHVELGSFLKESLVNNVYYIGRYKEDVKIGFGPTLNCFDTASDLIKIREQIMSQSKYVFIKASRSLQLETILDIK